MEERIGKREGAPSPYLSPIGAWAFALGTSIGWGSLVVTSNSYLLQAGPWGSVIGLLAGAAVMVVIARNYHYLMNRFPESGGAYTYAKEVFGYDHGFLVAWFLGLTYIAMFWANDTSLPLFARYFVGDAFQFGFHYTVFGYEVHLGEILLSAAAIVLAALLCSRSRVGAMRLMVGMALLFTGAIAFCFIAAAFGFSGGLRGLDPGFIPDKGAVSQVLLIACISPWAFVGFENISHSTPEFAFPRTRAFRIMVAAIATATALYLCVMLLSVMAYPPEYGSWLEYLSDLGNLDGLAGIPAFYAAHHYLGDFGVTLLMLALLCLVVTSLIGNIVALSRLFHALACDSVIPRGFSAVNGRGIPARAIALVAVISLLIPFLGRTAIGWIVDVTTIGATIIYGFVSASALTAAHRHGDRAERVTGAVGLVLMVAVGLYLLLPSLFMSRSLATESYFLFTAWGILGFAFFRGILRRDTQRRFGRSVIVWIGLLSLMVFFTFTWMSQALAGMANETMAEIGAYFLAQGGSSAQLQDVVFVEDKLIALKDGGGAILLAAAVLFIVAMAMLLVNFRYISRWAQESEEKLDLARGIAFTDPLTGVKSKHAYMRAESALNERIAAGEAGEFSVVVCDLNGLKEVNDTQGHKAGDEYLHAASEMICDTFQHSPVYRVGGDEFAVILTGRDYRSRHELMERLCALSREHVASGGAVVAAGLSNFIPDEDISTHTVFDRADARMYAMKRELKSAGGPGSAAR